MEAVSDAAFNLLCAFRQETALSPSFESRSETLPTSMPKMRATADGGMLSAFLSLVESRTLIMVFSISVVTFVYACVRLFMAVL